MGYMALVAVMSVRKCESFMHRCFTSLAKGNGVKTKLIAMM